MTICSPSWTLSSTGPCSPVVPSRTTLWWTSGARQQAGLLLAMARRGDSRICTLCTLRKASQGQQSGIRVNQGACVWLALQRTAFRLSLQPQQLQQQPLQLQTATGQQAQISSSCASGVALLPCPCTRMGFYASVQCKIFLLCLFNHGFAHR